MACQLLYIIVHSQMGESQATKLCLTYSSGFPLCWWIKTICMSSDTVRETLRWPLHIPLLSQLLKTQRFHSPVFSPFPVVCYSLISASGKGCVCVCVGVYVWNNTRTAFWNSRGFCAQSVRITYLLLSLFSVSLRSITAVTLSRLPAPSHHPSHLPVSSICRYSTCQFGLPLWNAHLSKSERQF